MTQIADVRKQHRRRTQGRCHPISATRAAIALLGLPKDAEERVLNAVAFDEGAVAEKLAELGQAEKPDHVDTPLDGGDSSEILR